MSTDEQASTPPASLDCSSASSDDEPQRHQLWERSPRCSDDSQSSELKRSSSKHKGTICRRSSFTASIKQALLFDRARAGDVEGLKEMLERSVGSGSPVPPAVDSTDEHGRTPLMYSAAFGHIEAVSYLLGQHDVNVNARDNRGKTALHHACNRARKMASGVAAEVAQLLLQASASHDACDCHAQMPIHLAADSGVEALIRVLLDAGTDVNAMDNAGRTPLDHACGRRTCGAVCDLLESHGGEGQEERNGEEPDRIVISVITAYDAKTLTLTCYSMGGTELGTFSVDVMQQLVGSIRMQAAKLLGTSMRGLKLILPNGTMLCRSNNATPVSELEPHSC